ncbi:MAG TPA: hypothetical protein VK601_28620 [Kofleriaceae bacterium]|nr:hypothetical protein [Kofleriaceae bacterium]
MAATNAATLLRRYPSDKESREIADAVLAKLAPQLAQLDVTCSAACTLLVDGKVAISVAREQHSLFAQPGGRSVTAVFGDGRKTTGQVTALANHITPLRLEAPRQVEARPAAPAGSQPAGGPGARRDRPAERQGLSKWWLVGGAVVTVGLGVATTLSGTATLTTRDQIRDAVAAGDDATAQMLYDTGRDQQTRTNVLLGATIAAGVATGVLAIFTDWSGSSERQLAVTPRADGAAVVYAGRF